MFKFLKDKIKTAISKFTEKAEEEVEEAPKETPVEEAAGPEEETKKEEAPVERQEEAKPAEEELAEPPEVKAEEETPTAKEIEEEKTSIEQPEEEAEAPKQEKVMEEAIPERIEVPEEKIVEEKEAEPVEGEPEEKAPVEEPQTGFFKKIKDKFKKPKEEAEKLEEPKEETVSQAPEEKKKSGLFRRIKEKVQTITISEQRFNELFWDLEVGMLENNVAVEVIEKIKEDLKSQLVDHPLPRGNLHESVVRALSDSIQGLFRNTTVDLIKAASQKKPYVICFVGVNGSGKTTTIAKMAHLFQSHKMSVVLAAADTFRAAAIDQLELHANKLAVKLIKHDYGSDPAAVAFDAVKHAESKNKDVVLIDTAGRLHSNANLMDEMKKVVRVAKPDLVLFVGEAITGNDCVEQAKMFNEAVNIDGIILSKADVDEKGGAAISISHVTDKPVLYLGTGQNYDDLKRFDPSLVLDSLGLAAS